ncbi:MAG: PAS domain S-box protein [Ignavibacteriales bacterium]|nr:PAS domain S-box protein [Ignavibacteriales bacterium]
MFTWIRDPSLKHAEQAKTREASRPSSAVSLIDFLQSHISDLQSASSVVHAVESFRSQEPAEQLSSLPAIYLEVEQYLVELDPYKKFLREQLREIVKTRYAQVLEGHPNFKLIFYPTERQELLLCQRFLSLVLSLAGSSAWGRLQEDIGSALQWVNKIPHVSGMVPLLGVTQSVPLKESEWIGFLRKCSRTFYEKLESSLGERAVSRIYEESYGNLADRYIGLETFPVVIDLLPDILLDREKIAILNLGRIRRGLSEKTEQLHEINEQLLTRNKELATMRSELNKAKDQLEVRVEERTSELQATNERLLAEIHERKRTEEALRLSQEYARNIIDSSLDMIIAVDKDRKIIEFNLAAQETFGFTREEILGKDVGTLYATPGDSREVHKNTVHKGGYTQEVMNKRKNGDTFPSLLSASLLKDAAGSVIGYMGISRDITKENQAEEELRKSEEQYRALFEESKDVVFVSTPEGSLLDINPAGVELFGYSSKEELLKTAMVDLFVQPEDQGRYHELLRTQFYVKDYELSLKRKRDGQRLSVAVTASAMRDGVGKILAYRGIMRDVTERRQLEQQLLQSQKLESIGLLAGGIAHDINNVLTPIIMASEIFRDRLSDEESQRMLDMVESSAKRGADIVKQILTVARRVDGERAEVQLKHLIKEMAKIGEETFPKSIRTQTSIHKDLWTIMGDATQLHQILLNLSVNARDAMPDGGTLTLAAENILLDEHYARMHLDAKPGPYVMIQVADTGTGIPSDKLHRIFEPFFTTKEPGKGTGLGLSTVHAIIKNHQGFINTYSEIGKGTQFSVYIPAVPAHTAAAEERQQVPLRPGNGELVLIVDDESSVLEVTKATLVKHGYRALTAMEGTEAVGLFAKNKNEIKAVITDMSMPVMDGIATIRALRRIDPQVRVIVASGRAEHKKETEAASLQVQAFLEKPYTADKLLRTLQEVHAGRTPDLLSYSLTV